MISIPIAAVLLAGLSTGPIASTSAAPAGVPILGDECIYPAGWSPPFTHVYHLRNGSTVVFVATQHTRDPSDATHRQIEQAFERYHPSFALVEGVASSKSGTVEYRRFLTEAATRDTERGAIQETLFTVKLAVDHAIDFSGWDFSPDELYRGDVADNIAIEDALGAHLIRAKVDPGDSVGGAKPMSREVGYAVRVKPIDAFDYPAWYRANYGHAFDPSHANPCGDGVAGRVTKDETRRRNLNLAALIDRHAVPGAVVLVEAGANHWLALQGYLRSVARSWT